MRLLSTREAADRLGIQPDTLKLWRHQGKGPPFIKMGGAPQAAVGYDPADIEAWMSERRFASTSAYSTAGLRAVKPVKRQSSGASA